MDNRRVMKAYRERAREKVLPYPARGGLLTKVKRYFSGPQPRAGNTQQTRSATQPVDVTANNSMLPPPETSYIRANNTTADADATTNRILLSFFQEKGDRPLTQIEYEGVMSLLEKSRASITLPLPESPPKNETTSGEPDAPDRQNQTFAPTSQTVLRNVSMYDHSASLSTPDYKPVYHTFSDTSRANISVRRVYQFSGLPSPYKTRIRAPNLRARRAKRLASSSAGNESIAEETTPVETAKPLSNAANSLLSILDGQGSETTEKSVDRPLHNPFARNKRRTPISEPPAKRLLGAGDISKTVQHNKAEELDETKATTFGFGKLEKASDGTANDVEKDKKTSGTDTKTLLFGNSTLAKKDEPLFKASVGKKKESISSAPKDKSGLFSSVKSPEKEPTQSTSFNFGAKAPANPSIPTLAFSFGSKELEKPVSFGSKDEEKKLSFGAQPTKEQKTFAFGAKENSSGKPFSFGAKESNPEKPFSFGNTENNSKEDKPFSFGAKTSEKSLFGKETSGSADKPLFGSSTVKLSTEEASIDSTGKLLVDGKIDNKPAFSFGAKTDDKPAFSFGAKTDRPQAPLLSFGNSATPAVDTEATSKKNPKITFGAQNGAYSNGNGAHSKTTDDFEFPTVNVGAGDVDESKVEQYKSLYEF